MELQTDDVRPYGFDGHGRLRVERKRVVDLGSGREVSYMSTVASVSDAGVMMQDRDLGELVAGTPGALDVLDGAVEVSA
jgi:hypothetical protein